MAGEEEVVEAAVAGEGEEVAETARAEPAAMGAEWDMGAALASGIPTLTPRFQPMAHTL
jgi:hypothetical protein